MTTIKCLPQGVACCPVNYFNSSSCHVSLNLYSKLSVDLTINDTDNSTVRAEGFLKWKKINKSPDKIGQKIICFMGEKVT